MASQGVCSELLEGAAPTAPTLVALELTTVPFKVHQDRQGLAQGAPTPGKVLLPRSGPRLPGGLPCWLAGQGLPSWLLTPPGSGPPPGGVLAHFLPWSSPSRGPWSLFLQPQAEAGLWRCRA